jgi:hypothetical protein
MRTNNALKLNSSDRPLQKKDIKLTDLKHNLSQIKGTAGWKYTQQTASDPHNHSMVKLPSAEERCRETYECRIGGKK